MLKEKDREVAQNQPNNAESDDDLRHLFPAAFDKEKIANVDLVREKIEARGFKSVNQESYGFSWPGKAYALNEALSPANGVLKPRPEISIDFDRTNNTFIVGDNLAVLKILTQTLSDKVKMIYVDPPYNANSAQKIYKDDFREKSYGNKRNSALNSESADELAEYGKRNHSKWLSMIYPRMFLARRLLREDGLMFVSIDDTEVHNLWMVLNEIFGEDNLEMMVWRKVDSNEGKLKLVRRFRIEHEYILVAYKNKDKVRFKKVDEIPVFRNLAENVDKDPRGPWMSGNISSTEEISVKTGKNYYEVVSPGGRRFRRQWKFPKSEFDRLASENRIYWGKEGRNVPRLKVFSGEPRSIYVSSIIERKGTAKSADAEMKRLVGVESCFFPHPKPVALVQYLIDAAQTKGSIVLDFFAGSGTTAEALLAQNILDGGDRSFILVQLPEPIHFLKEEAVDPTRKIGKIRSAADITRYRIAATIEKFGLKKPVFSIDLGVKVFEYTALSQGKINMPYTE